ncbi:37S ribosomal protein S9, mitochondrial [Coemansia sp. RSA 1813]|nr:37S ribosomal protein S9, mitochondrial [Coemansia sp. RSA 1646]KAJ1767160.1 37S ribosomal protein S9, mitochondrial [Coemansia sp. RSA 1843]KAJ2085760.1 37S ribosomal protein S9, mitochondrial [Coemansia sp. RSA 986]KAJ2210632.1 37S ribosomal protein S9, mitochondrial [Coemansia sp. RSA 487]KAJ2563377.1 37S ribosomal protein S9, mitochondrial [Coemansia sp. RSA 1813]
MLARLRIAGAKVPYISIRALTQESSSSTSSRSANSPFDSLDIRPIKRPDTPSYFMPKPKYSDMLAAVTSIVQQHEQPRRIDTEASRKKKKMQWLSKKDFETKFNLRLTMTEFQDLKVQLKAAKSALIWNKPEKKTVNLYLAQFAKEEEPVDGLAKKQKKTSKRKKTRGCKDEVGRWTAGGRRKEAFASVMVAPVKGPEPGSDAGIADALMAATTEIAGLLDGLRRVFRDMEWTEGRLLNKAKEAAEGEVNPEEEEVEEQEEATQVDPVRSTVVEVVKHAPLGEVLVNGRPLAEYFVRDADRDAVLLPMVMSESVGQYNVFLRVKGGGHTGQAEACQLALSRALFSCNRGKHGAIMKAGLLTPDNRFVERKKTGKPKARKSYTWVKR